MAYTDVTVINGLTIRALHDTHGKKSFGFLVMPVDNDGNAAGDPVKVDTLFDAYLEAGFEFNDRTVDIGYPDWNWKDAERCNDHIIRKLLYSFSNSVAFAYIVIPLKGEAKITRHDNLTAARKACGFDPAKITQLPDALTKPKSSYSQNRKGYDPANVR